MKTTKIKFFVALSVLILTLSCGSNGDAGTPKPYGYFRISMPENEYQIFSKKGNPYTFEYSTIAKIDERTDKPDENWINIVYPQHDATIYITYKPIKNNLDTLINDTHNFTYRHTIKADAIDESTFFFPDKRVFALYNEVEGNAASPIQFLLTDSTKNFLIGSLYFNVSPNVDSVAPVLDFIRQDIIHLINTLEWKK
jgi:gliding motility-associated lipoprotein GldD